MRLSRCLTVLRLILITATVITFTHCGTEEDGSDKIFSDFSDIYTNIIAAECETCHRPDGNSPVIDLSTEAKAYAALRNGVVQGGSATVCHGVPIVVPSSPASSYLMAIFKASEYNKNDFGGKSGCKPLHSIQDPDGTQFLSTSGAASFEAWIKAGAGS